MTPAQARVHSAIEADLRRLARYDDESVVHEAWIRQRYDRGLAASYVPARAAAVRTAWHEAGHAVAALAVGARFSSASILAGGASSGRVHGVRGGGELGFVVDAAGQVAERLRDWTLPETDDEVRAWLASWRGDGGDARRFRAALRPRFGADEAAAWRHAAAVLTPLRPRIRQVARALLVYPRHLPYAVTAAIAGGAVPGQGREARGRDGIGTGLPAIPAGHFRPPVRNYREKNAYPHKRIRPILSAYAAGGPSPAAPLPRGEQSGRRRALAGPAGPPGTRGVARRSCATGSINRRNGDGSVSAMGTFIIIIVILVAGGYLVSLRRHPFVRCRTCKGSGRHYGSVYTYAHRRCARCGGSGRQDRLGVRLFR